MKILFLANRFPYPPFRGDKLKIYNLTKRLSKEHDLYLLTFYEKRSELEYLQELTPFFKEVELVYLPKWRSLLNCVPALFSKTPLQLAYFKSRKMHRKLKQVLEEQDIDVIHTQHLRMSQYTKNLSLPRVLDLPDAFSLYWKRRKDTDRAWYERLVDQVEISRLLKAEGVINSFDKCLVCSAEDKKYLEKVHGSKHIDILLNGVDLSTFDVGSGHGYELKNNILFTGNMDYAPNVDAVHYFVEEIFPSILDTHPTIQFTIAGQRPVRSVRDLSEHPNVIVTGFIPKLQEVYEQADILVAPLRFGAGTQNKVLEAMAMGLPVVCTNIGFEGLGVKQGEGVFLGKNTQQFTDHVLRLLGDTSLRQMTGEKGLNKAQNTSSWDVVSKDLETHLHSVLN